MKIRKGALGVAWCAMAAGAGQSAVAADAPALGAGSLLQQVPQSQPLSPGRNIEALPRPAEQEQYSDTKPFLVRRFVIEGNTVYSTEKLHALIADQEGQPMGLAGLMTVAQRISDHYQNHGYSLTRAIIPAQKIVNGVVRVQVVEARLGRVRLKNKSIIEPDVLQGIVNGALTRGELIMQDGVERAILLLTDLPGLTAESLVKPGGRVGESDLDIDTKPAGDSPLTGRGMLDTAGNAYTGRNRLSTNLNWLNPLHRGDVASVNTLSTGSGLSYTNFSYEGVALPGGSRAGASLSNMNYNLGGAAQASGSHGTAQVMSAWFKYPWIRSLNQNVAFQVQADRTQLEDDIDASNTTNKRHLSAFVFSATGDRTSEGRYTTWRVAGTTGSLAFDDADAQASDLASAYTQGNFSKLSFTVMHLQTLKSGDDFFVRVTGQKSSVNLDPSQKLIVGGPNSVRAYDVSAVTGDVGLDTSFELRRNLGALGPGRLQGLAFFDYATVNINAYPWPGAGNNSAQLAGAGVGLNWSTARNMRVKCSLATPLGGAPDSVSSTSKLRAWLELSAMF